MGLPLNALYLFQLVLSVPQNDTKMALILFVFYLYFILSMVSFCFIHLTSFKHMALP